MEKYKAKLAEHGITAGEEYPSSLSFTALSGKKKKQAELQHAYWMFEQIPQILAIAEREKYNRWLGFAQSLLCTNGLVTIEDLRNDTRGLDT